MTEHENSCHSLVVSAAALLLLPPFLFPVSRSLSFDLTLAFRLQRTQRRKVRRRDSLCVTQKEKEREIEREHY